MKSRNCFIVLYIMVPMLAFNAGVPGIARAAEAGNSPVAIAKSYIDVPGDALYSYGALDRYPGGNTKDLILEKARNKLSGYFSQGHYRFDITARWIPRNLLAQPPESIVAVEIRGEVQRYTDFEVLYQDRGSREEARIQLGVDIERKLPVVVRRISRGEVIKSEDLEEQWVSLSRNKGEMMEDASAITGKTLRRTLLSGQPVRSSYLSREYIIEAGDRVKLIIENQGVHVQLFGEARQHGAKGDIIKIYSEETRKKYEGEIIRPGVIKWKKTF